MRVVYNKNVPGFILQIIKLNKQYSVPLFVFIGILFTAVLFYYINYQQHASQVISLNARSEKLNLSLASVSAQLKDLQSQDQVKINLENKKEIDSIQKTYKSAVNSYEDLIEISVTNKNLPKMQELLAKALSQLSEKNYASAQASLTALDKQIAAENVTVSSEFTIPTNVKQSNTPPGAGYSRQSVKTDLGTYLVDIISADLNSTRVIVDTASDGDCRDNCPVLSLGDYAARSGAFAGVNGSYFCPASYPSCAGKTNSFDTLLMNKNKVYFNSDNNVYSTVPVVAFGSGWARFMGRSSDWGRDTGVDGVIANQPLLVSGGKSVFGGDDEAKRAGKGSRSFVANKGNVVYIGVAHNVSAAEMAKVLETMGMDNALNLDSGGSTALWSGGYKVGPGRNIPNAVLFVRK